MGKILGITHKPKVLGSDTHSVSLIIAGIQKFILLVSTPRGSNTRLLLLRKNMPPVSLLIIRDEK